MSTSKNSTILLGMAACLLIGLAAGALGRADERQIQAAINEPGVYLEATVKTCSSPTNDEFVRCLISEGNNDRK